MRRRLTFALAAAAFVGNPVLLAHAQAPRVATPALVVTRHGGVAGIGIGFGAGVTGKHAPLIVGTGHVGAGTNGTSMGVGNATGGIGGSTRAGTGGVSDAGSWGTLTGGLSGTGRGLGAGTGGIGDRIELGLDTGSAGGGSIRSAAATAGTSTWRSIRSSRGPESRA